MSAILGNIVYWNSKGTSLTLVTIAKRNHSFKVVLSLFTIIVSLKVRWHWIAEVVIEFLFRHLHVIDSHVLPHGIFLLEYSRSVRHETVNLTVKLGNEIVATDFICMLNVIWNPLVILNTIEIRSLYQWTIFTVRVFHLLIASLLFYLIYPRLQVERQSFLPFTSNIYSLYLIFGITCIL